MRRFALVFLSFALACHTDETGPRPAAHSSISIAAANDDGPPSSFPTGSDTYRLGVFTGAVLATSIVFRPLTAAANATGTCAAT